MKNKKRLLSNFFSLSILQIFTYILPLLTLPYLVRVLGVERFGLVMFAQSYIMFFSIIVDFGFNLSAVREVSVYRDNKNKLTEIFSSVMIIKGVLILISLGVLTATVFLIEKFESDKTLYFLTFLWVIGQAMFPIWYFQGIEKMKYITIINITSRLIFTIAIFLFVHSKEDYLLVPILNGLGFITGGVLSLWIIRQKFDQKFRLQTAKTIWKHFKQSAEFFLSRVSVAIYTSANTFVLGIFTNNTMVGYYAIAEQLYKAILGLYQPLAQVLYPYIAKEKNITLFKKIFIVAVTINTLGIIALYLIDSYIFDLLFTEKIGNESSKVFHIFLIASLIVVPSVLIGYPFLGALGHAKYANLSVVYASIFHLFGIGMLILFNQVTIYNVAFLVIGTQTVDFIYRFYGVSKEKLWNTKR